MKKKRITYGISGMMEYQVVIKIGNSAKMKVMFSDGSMTATGVTPATFTTDNLMIQHAIERSPDFLNKRIHIVRSIELNENVNIERNPTKKDSINNANAPKTTKKIIDDSTTVDETKKADITDDLLLKDKDESTKEEIISSEESKSGELTTVEVTDLTTAREYLNEKFEIEKKTILSKASILDAAKAHNIVFVGLS